LVDCIHTSFFGCEISTFLLHVDIAFMMSGIRKVFVSKFCL
jgi:hypothetical protein